MRKLTGHDMANIIGTTVSMYHIETVSMYHIEDARVKRGNFSDSDHYGILLGRNANGNYVTWQFHLEDDEQVNVYWGHYFNEDREAAIDDFHWRDTDPASTLNSDYWDCECDDKFIQSKATAECQLCGAQRYEMPDSRREEIDKGIYFAE